MAQGYCRSLVTDLTIEHPATTRFLCQLSWRGHWLHIYCCTDLASVLEVEGERIYLMGKQKSSSNLRGFWSPFQSM
jgi:hypothetical protein